MSDIIRKPTKIKKSKKDKKGHHHHSDKTNGKFLEAEPAAATGAVSEQRTDQRLKRSFYEKELARLQFELLKLQYSVKAQGLKVLLIFEGRDAAGKGGMIKRITEALNPRGVRLVALGKPSDVEATQWYFQRYVEHLPASGEIVIFDRSWYNRAGV